MADPPSTLDRAAPPPADDSIPRRAWWALSVSTLVVFLVVIDISQASDGIAWEYLKSRELVPADRILLVRDRAAEAGLRPAPEDRLFVYDLNQRKQSRKELRRLLASRRAPKATHFETQSPQTAVG